jgi:quercetin dioxygenase-like cupin family protein
LAWPLAPCSKRRAPPWCADERTRIDYGGSGVADWLLSPDTEAPLQAILSEIAPGGGGGEELYTLSAELVFVFVLSGSLRVIMEDGVRQLGAGDAFTYSPREPHTWGNASQTEPATVLWVLTPSPYGKR